MRLRVEDMDGVRVADMDNGRECGWEIRNVAYFLKRGELGGCLEVGSTIPATNHAFITNPQ